MSKKCLLIILDGWGLGNKDKADLIYNGNTPFFKHLLANYPNSKLNASGEDVGLPEGQMGNSEVGHLNIGSGRIVYQDLVKINIDIRNKDFFNNPTILDAINYAKINNKSVHLLGLVSDGGVHSLDKHVYALCDIAKQNNFNKLFIHALLDGRDTDPYSGAGFIKNLEDHIKTSAGKIATICGRYYTMDRDKRWERIKRGYDLMLHGIGTPFSDPVAAITKSYESGITDEFVEPIVIVDENNSPVALIEEGDVVFCFNFRTDRLREITTVLTQQDMPEFDMKTLPLKYYTMTTYDENFKNVNVVYKKDNVENTLGQVVADNGLSQLRIAETEKYAHVTFFFSGGREEIFSNEERILIPSPKVATYDLQPEMSAPLITEALIKELNQQKFDFICLNFANGDMVGHTGIKEAILAAVQAVDNCVKEVVASALANNYDCLLIADHGNADNAINEDGSPNTAHSLNPVPCIYISNSTSYNTLKDGRLSDVAPTILKIMGLEIPKSMTGNLLFH